MVVEHISDYRELISLTDIWKRLDAHAQVIKPIHLRDLLLDMKFMRNEKLRLNTGDIKIDFTRQRIDQEGLDLLFELAKKAKLKDKISAMFRGDKVNLTENRSALHIALRLPANEVIQINGKNIVDDVHGVLRQMEEFTYRIYDNMGRTRKKIRKIVSIGIGGSNLGPEMAYEALKEFGEHDIEVRFIANVDPLDFKRNTENLDPEETLFIIESKTFLTPEVMRNAKKARTWIVERLGEDKISEHFIAVSTNTEEVEKFGIKKENMFEFWDWVGGRFSVTSAIGLPVMLAIGPEKFKDFLDGFYTMDQHYLNTPFEKNLPVMMALLHIWSTNFLQIQTHGIISYSEQLALFPLHLQQLIMESLGKGVTQNGHRVDFLTCPIFYPGVGTNHQHSFQELVVQESLIDTAQDMIGFILPSTIDDVEGQALLNLNMIAQANTMAKGLTEQELQEAETPKNLIAHKVLSGNNQSTIIYAERLTPRILGGLIALYEHMVHAWGSILDINPFDQMGVEAAKNATKKLEERLSNRSLTVNVFGELLK